MRSITDLSPPSLLAPAALAAALLFTSGSASASGGYPTTIASKYGVGAPACTLCHTNPSGGAGTAEQPFAVTMKKYGLTGNSATAALEQALEDNTDDSDSDGTPDVDELQNGGDPNSGGAAVDPAKYGCVEQSNSIAGARSSSPRLASLAVAGLVAGFLFLRRRR
ncbi:MAG TPA: hypothetical protein VFS43_14985 [Polyangiaceae bacterium]|nr:hypothetical protein [Polyangiaceae bacterium]